MSMQSSNVVALNPFRQWSMHGYKELIPIIPPAADLSENSYIRKNKSQGKAPGIRYPSGQWGGLPGWREVAASESDIDDWHAMGAGVGLRRGAAFMLDIDATDEAVADSIEAAAIAALGEAPMRVGRWPKRALLYRADGPIDGGKLIFEGPDGAPNQIELPAQMVVFGIHPVTGKPYEWRRKPVAFAELTPVSQAQLDDFMEAQRRLLPKAKRETGAAAVDRAAIDQATLTGRPEHVKAAIAALPNTRDAFPTYDSMVLIGNALHAALPEDTSLANELWHEWCARWEGGDYSAELTEKRWDTLQAPHTVGAKYIYEKAAELGGFDRALTWFEELPTSLRSTGEASLFPAEQSPMEIARARIKATPYAFPPVSTIPVRAFLYGSHYTRQFVSATVAPSGVGKSSLTLVEALAMATGKPLLGVEPKQCCRVWLWNGEDPRNELDRRINAAMQHYGLTPEDFGGRLFIDSGRDVEIIMATQTRDGARIAAPVSAAVLAELANRAIDVLVVDPFVSSHRVSENDNDAIDMVTKEWARIADRTNSAVELVHHVRKLNGAEISVEDSRGAVALIATSRSARALAKMTKGEAGRLGLEHVRPFLFRFADGKANMSPPIATDDTAWMELRNVALGNGEGGGVDALLTGDNVQVVCAYRVEGVPAVAADETAIALATIASGEWRRDVRAGDAWVGAAVAQAMHFDMDNGDDKARVKQIISEWIKNGLLKEVTRNDEKRRPRAYVICAEADNVSAGVFE